LATTSKVAFQDDDKVHVVYLYMGQGDAETVLPFYKPHTVFGSVLHELIHGQDEWKSTHDNAAVSAGT
jgi:hypothetical protein